MFYGLSVLFADSIAIIGPLLIIAAEGPLVFRLLTQRRLAPIVSAAFAGPPPPQERRVDTRGLLDDVPTERIRISESLRGERTAREPVAAPESCHAHSAVLVGGGGASEPRVRPSIRERRS